MHHLAAFAESLDPAGALVNVAAVQDDSLTTQGDDLRVPVALPYMLGSAALISATSPIQAQFQSPSLRQIANVDVEPAALGLVFGDPAEVDMHPESPIPLAGDESLNFLVNTDPSSAEIHYGLVWFSDGAVNPVRADSYAIRATASMTAVATSWVSGQITLGQDLPVGNYEVIGLRVRAAGLVAARLNFVGGAYRPGVPGAVAIDDVISERFRYGRMGSYGVFHTNNPPKLEVIAAAGAISPVIIMDVVPRS